MNTTDTETQLFSTDPSGLPTAAASEVMQLADGDTYELRITPIANRVGDDTVRMLGYNGSVPGPTLRVRQGSEIAVRVRNDGDYETTVHWHGLRVANEYDGVPFETQAPIPVGGEFTYRLRFPDEGLYWYHPHVREDYGIEMGLYGTILVDPADAAAWPPVNHELVATLDDLLIEDGHIATFSTAGPTHTAMGRFGNLMLTSGKTDPRLDVRAGDVVRFFVVNTANTRIFQVMIPGARIKLVAGDASRYEREEFVDAVLLSPSERVVVDVRFETPGEFAIEHASMGQTYRLGGVTVANEPTAESHAESFEVLHDNAELATERARLGAELARPADKTLVLDAEMPMMHGGHHAHHDAHDSGGDAGDGDGVEWEDLMPEMNAQTDDTNMIWKLVDADTGKFNHEIDWVFRVGDRVKLRLVNTMDSDHPMHHPFHIHGAGRFLVIARDDVAEPNLVWKDTVLVRAGETVDIVLEVTSPGVWMAHCHIAEHNQNGMMLSFRVEERA